MTESQLPLLFCRLQCHISLLRKIRRSDGVNTVPISLGITRSEGGGGGRGGEADNRDQHREAQARTGQKTFVWLRTRFVWWLVFICVAPTLSVFQREADKTSQSHVRQNFRTFWWLNTGFFGIFHCRWDRGGLLFPGASAVQSKHSCYF